MCSVRTPVEAEHRLALAVVHSLHVALQGSSAMGTSIPMTDRSLLSKPRRFHYAWRPRSFRAVSSKAFWMPESRGSAE